MKSIRAKIILLAISIAIITMISTLTIGAISINNLGHNSTEEILSLLCQTGEKKLDLYFKSVEQSVKTVSELVEDNLESTGKEHFDEHIEHVREFFSKAAFQTYGVLTYYYRIDPEFSQTEKGFWYTNVNGSGFEEHEVTDITLYDTSDTSSLVWFTVPKYTGKPIWLPPYITDNLDVRVISYNTPIYYEGTFVGVVGIELDYTTMATEVDSIRLYENGYAFVNDADGNLVYHPRLDVTTMTEDEKPKVPSGLLYESGKVETYTFEGIKKQAVWYPLSNGMNLVVTVPVSEINDDWQRMLIMSVIWAIVLLFVIIVVSMQFSKQLSKPLEDLTVAANEIEKGNYDIKLDYDKDDEVGTLSKTFKHFTSHLRSHINDLTILAHTDALTSVQNKGAYDIYLEKLQSKIANEEKIDFAVAIFDCDSLKSINDQFGHEKGDMYLKNTTNMISSVFKNSLVYRIGGDEFAVILEGDDYINRNELIDTFKSKCLNTCSDSYYKWEQLKISVGLAYYLHNNESVQDVARRADSLMYENKHKRKESANR